MQIEKRLNGDFENLHDLFVNNKLSIHIGEDKKKSILFASKQRAKNVCQLNIEYKDKCTTAFGSNISWMHPRQINIREQMALKVINKIHGKLKFLYGKNTFRSPEL